MSSVTFSFDADQITGMTIGHAMQTASRHGYKVIIRDPEDLLNYDWLHEHWGKKIIFVTARNGYVAGVQRVHSDTAGWDGHDR